jgi:regulator of extracellular matrix RemA (YlzA/DUF370 family)
MAKKRACKLRRLVAIVKRAKSTISKLLDFFEENGLIITRMDGRERVAELLTSSEDSSLSSTEPLTLADSDSVYKKWLRSHSCSVAQEETLRLLDPFTGEEVKSNHATLEFKIDFQTVKVTEPKDSCVKKSEPSPKQLEEFEDALKS